MAAGVAWQPAVAHISRPCVRISSAYPPSDISVIRAIAIAKERPRPTCRIIRIGDGEVAAPYCRPAHDWVAVWPRCMTVDIYRVTSPAQRDARSDEVREVQAQSLDSWRAAVAPRAIAACSRLDLDEIDMNK